MKTSLKTTIQTFCHDLSAKTRHGTCDQQYVYIDHGKFDHNGCRIRSTLFYDV